MEYNNLQLDAIKSTDNKILVTACPGSGKSTSLVGAVSYYLDAHPKDNVVAITFTRKAANDLSVKLIDYPTVFPCTIHSWSLSELRKLSYAYDFKVKLLQEEDIKEILRTIYKKLNYYHVNEFLLYLYVTGNYNLDIPRGTKARFEAVSNRYEQYKRGNSLYDFMDLPLYLFDELTEHDVYIESIDGLFVDEFQDVDPIQAQIFNRVRAQKYFYIGDERQAIYKFRGADSTVLEKLEGFTEHNLNINYRSGQDILDFSSTLYHLKPNFISDINRLDNYGEDRIEGARLLTGEVNVCKANGIVHNLTTNNVGNAISFLTGYIYKKKPYILCRSNKIVKMVKKLGYDRVSTVHQAKGLEYKDVLVVDFQIEEDNEEELNIAYVACTRAKDTLTIVDVELLERALENPSLRSMSKAF